MLQRTILAVALIYPRVLDANAEDTRSPIAVFYDEKLLDAATREIMGMSHEQLSGLTKVISECEDRLSENDLIQHLCSVAEYTYEIEFGSKMAVDELLDSMDGVAMSLHYDELSHKNTPEDGNRIARIVNIMIRLRRAANLRFEMLRSGQ